MGWQKTLEKLARSQGISINKMMWPDKARKLGIPNFVLHAYFRSRKTGKPIDEILGVTKPPKR